MDAQTLYPFASHFRHRAGWASDCICHLSAMLKPERRCPPSSTPITPLYLKRHFSFECDAETGIGSINVVTEVAVACADIRRAQETCSPDYDSTAANLRCFDTARCRVPYNVYSVENFEDRTPLLPSRAMRFIIRIEGLHKSSRQFSLQSEKRTEFRISLLRFSLDHSKSAPPQRKLLSDGLVAEWLRRGLQILAPRFDSGRGLQFPLNLP